MRSRTTQPVVDSAFALGDNVESIADHDVVRTRNSTMRKLGASRLVMARIRSRPAGDQTYSGRTLTRTSTGGRRLRRTSNRSLWFVISRNR